jgi:hypothetical protein
MQDVKKPKSPKINAQEKRLIELKAQYRILSQIEDILPVKSNSRVYSFVHRNLHSILKEIAELNTPKYDK